MVLFFTLLALQTAATVTGGVYLWRRSKRLEAEVRELRAALAPNVLAPLDETPAPVRPAPVNEPRTTEVWIAVVTTIAATAPVLGLTVGAPVQALSSAGVCAGATLLAASLRPSLGRLSWPGMLVAALWAVIGVVFGGGSLSFAISLAGAGIAAVIHATLRRSSAGQVGAALMAAAALALGAQDSIVSPAGAAFAAIALSAAVAGALRLELEAMHVAAFGAALIGLLVLSGQDGAALWFTPAAALTAAAFFAIAAVRVPQLGERGVTLAGVGAAAPLMSTAAIHVSQHGLEDRMAAAGAFFVFALMLGGLLSTSANRGDRGYASLGSTLWVLAVAIFTAVAAAVSIATPAPLAASITACAALALLAIAQHRNVQALQFFACASAGLTLAFALRSAQHLLGEASSWPGYAVLAIGGALPASILGIAALAALRAKQRATSAVLEICAILLGVATLSLGLRLLAANGAPLLHPLSFAEAGAHVVLWLASAFLLRRRARKGARQARIIAAHALTYAGLITALVSSALWLTPVWTGKVATLPILSRDTIGFALPAVGFYLLWALWRWRGVAYMARICFSAGAILVAAFAAAEISRMDSSEGGLPSIAATVLLFAGAAAASFLPTIVRRRSAHPREVATPIRLRKAA